MALSYAKSQHEATRRAVDAWSCLRDGFVGSSIIPSTQIRKPSTTTTISRRRPKPDVSNEEPPTATIFSSLGDQGPIVAFEHDLFRMPNDTNSCSNGNDDSEGNSSGGNGSNNYSGGSASDAADEQQEVCPPFAVASPILDDVPDNGMMGSSMASDSFGVTLSHHSSSHATLLSSASIPSIHNAGSTGSPVNPNSRTVDPTNEIAASDNEVMTSSMQSLVDGLMNWGGIDVEEDFALPQGMAASIAMEGSAVFGSKAS
jgi:hypothetical protein